jgi:hypothetical protein
VHRVQVAQSQSTYHFFRHVGFSGTQGWTLGTMSHSKSDHRTKTATRDLTPYSSSRACGGNLKIGVCLLSSNVLAHNHHRLESQCPFHNGRHGIGRQVTQQVGRLSRGTPVHLPFPVCSSEANIRSYPAWQLRYRGSHMIFRRLQNKGHGSIARCLQDSSENSKILLSNNYKCPSLSSVLSGLT